MSGRKARERARTMRERALVNARKMRERALPLLALRVVFTLAVLHVFGIVWRPLLVSDVAAFAVAALVADAARAMFTDPWPDHDHSDEGEQ